MTIISRLSENPDQRDALLQDAARVLRRGGLVAFPTETVYGLGANAGDEQAVRALFAAKGRPGNNPLIVHVADIAAAAQVVAEWPALAARLARRFWPGPLTLVLPKRSDLPDVVTGGGPTVAVRVPGHPVAHRLLQLAGVPVAAPSANRSGHLSPTTAEHVRADLGGRIDLILDAGPTSIGLESTVLSLVDDPPRLLRPGFITADQIEQVIGPIQRSGPETAAGAPLPSPGMLARHYAPRTPLEIAAGSGEARVVELVAKGQRVGWLTLSDVPTPAGPVATRRLPADPAGYGAHLYAALHELDARGLDRIVVECPPLDDAWLAVRDRLGRAAVQD